MSANCLRRRGEGGYVPPLRPFSVTRSVTLPSELKCQMDFACMIARSTRLQAMTQDKDLASKPTFLEILKPSVRFRMFPSYITYNCSVEVRKMIIYQNDNPWRSQLASKLLPRFLECIKAQ